MSNLMFTKSKSPPIREFNSKTYVKLWLEKSHYANDTQSR